MPIHILPPEVANQIAAGEVVERPASAVKELIENSLDAGATDIRVEVREGGRRLIRIQDDGCGIPAAEAGLAFERHATSKLATADDLSHITTLGFRGEALASIASVAQVALLTRARDEGTGTLIRMAEGREVGREPKGTPPGTLVTVEHLFANVPARLKFLKQPATEAAHIQQIVTRYALAYPERRFNLVSDGKLVFQSTGSGKLYDVLVKVYGLEVAREMLRNRRIRRISESANRNESDEAATRRMRIHATSVRHSLIRHSLIRSFASPATSARPPSTAATGATSRFSSTGAGSRIHPSRMPRSRRITRCCRSGVTRWRCSSSRSRPRKWTSTCTRPRPRCASGTAARFSARCSGRCGGR